MVKHAATSDLAADPHGVLVTRCSLLRVCVCMSLMLFALCLQGLSNFFFYSGKYLRWGIHAPEEVVSSTVPMLLCSHAGTQVAANLVGMCFRSAPDTDGDSASESSESMRVLVS